MKVKVYCRLKLKAMPFVRARRSVQTASFDN